MCLKEQNLEYFQVEDVNYREMLRNWIILLPVIENGIDGEEIQVASLEHHLQIIQSHNKVCFGEFLVLYFFFFLSRRYRHNYLKKSLPHLSSAFELSSGAVPDPRQS